MLYIRITCIPTTAKENSKNITFALTPNKRTICALEFVQVFDILKFIPDIPNFPLGSFLFCYNFLRYFFSGLLDTNSLSLPLSQNIFIIVIAMYSPRQELE